MYWSNGYWFGMNYLWWFVWVGILIFFFSVATPVSRRRYRTFQDSPLDILQRRFAQGEMTPEDYERRRELLLREAAGVGQVASKSPRTGIFNRRNQPPSITAPH